MLAVTSGNVDEAESMLARTGTLKNCADATGWTILHQCVSQPGDNTELAKTLCRGKINPNRSNKLRWTPLHVAAWKGKLGCLQVLLESGAHPDAKTADGQTPLHCVAINANVLCLSLLLDWGAQVDEMDVNQLTPLACVAQLGRAEASSRSSCAKVLLRAGADLSKLPDIPRWLAADARRLRCDDAAMALYGVLQLRWAPGKDRVPRDISRLLAATVRGTLEHQAWLF